jgi:tRNA pseudouridine55 synthase
MEGILLVNKPKGPTSFQVIKILRKTTGERKIGHAGTLDPAARGLLIVLIGKATKHAGYFEKLRKRYIARVELGMSTDTDDREGEIILQKHTDPVSRGTVQKVLSSFTGTIMQTPPRYSAVKFGGRRAYALARQGKHFQLEPRQVVVHALRMVYYHHPYIKIELCCSKGTYVRSIARDIGENLGTGAVLHSLIRTQIGPWGIAQSLHQKDLRSAGMVRAYLMPVESACAVTDNGARIMKGSSKERVSAS